MARTKLDAKQVQSWVDEGLQQDPPISEQESKQWLRKMGYTWPGEFGAGELGWELAKGPATLLDPYSPVSLDPDSGKLLGFDPSVDQMDLIPGMSALKGLASFRVPPVLAGIPNLGKLALGSLGLAATGLLPGPLKTLRTPFQEYPKTAVGQAKEFVFGRKPDTPGGPGGKDPLEGLYRDPVETGAALAPVLGQVATGAGLTKLGQALQWVDAPGELLSRGVVSGLGAVAESTPGVGGKAKRAKQQALVEQVDPDMLRFQQWAQEKGIIDPLDPKTGEGGLPAPVLSRDPGAVKVSRAIAQKGGDNAFLRDVNQFEKALDFEEQTFRDSIDPSDPVAAMSAAREGLARLEGKYPELSKMLDELGLDEMEADMPNVRKAIAELEGRGLGPRGSVDKAIATVLKNPNVQAFKKRAEASAKRTEVIDSGPAMDSQAYGQRLAPEIELSQVSSQEIVSFYEAAVKNSNTGAMRAVESRGLEILQDRIRHHRNTIQDDIRQQMALHRQQQDLVDDALASEDKLIAGLQRDEQFLRDYEARVFPYSDERGSYRLVALGRTVPGSGGQVRRTVDKVDYDLFDEAGLIEIGPDNVPYARRYFDEVQPGLEAEYLKPGQDRAAEMDFSQAVTQQRPEIDRQFSQLSARAEDSLDQIDTAEAALERLTEMIGKMEQTGLKERVSGTRPGAKPKGRAQYLAGKREVTETADDVVTIRELKKMKSNLGSDLATWNDSQAVAQKGDHSQNITKAYNKLYRAIVLDELAGYAKEVSLLEAADPSNAKKYGQLSRLLGEWRETSEWLSTEPARIIKTAVEKRYVDHPDGALDANGDLIKVPGYSELDVSTARQIVDGLFNKGWKIDPSLFKTGTLATVDMPMIREAIGPEAWHRLKAIWVHDTFEKARGPSGRISSPNSLQAELDKLGSHADDINRRLVEIGGGGEEGQAFAKLITDMSRRRGKSERLAGIFDDSTAFSFDKVKPKPKQPSRAWDMAKAVGMTEATGGVLLGRFLSPARMGRAIAAKALVMGLEGYGDMLNNPRKYKMTAADLADAPSLAEMTAQFKAWGLPVKHSRLARQIDQEEIKRQRQSRRQAKVDITPQASEAFNQLLNAELEL